jgi:hypothetical protein
MNKLSTGFIHRCVNLVDDTPEVRLSYPLTHE